MLKNIFQQGIILIIFFIYYNQDTIISLIINHDDTRMFYLSALEVNQESF